MIDSESAGVVVVKGERAEEFVAGKPEWQV